MGLSKVGKEYSTNQIIYFICLISFLFVRVNDDFSNTYPFTVYLSYIVLMLGWFIKDGFKIRIQIGRFNCWYFGFLLLCVISSYYSINSGTSWNAIKSVIYNVVALFLLYQLIQNESDVFDIIKCYCLTIVLILLYLTFKVGITALLSATRIGIHTGVFWNSNRISAVLSLGACFYSFYLSRTKEIKYKVILSILICITLLFMFLAGSRTFILFYLFSIILFVLQHKGGKGIRNTLKLCGVILLVYFLVMNNNILYQSIGVRFENLFELISGDQTNARSMLYREQFMTNGIKWFKERPLFGYGIDGFSILNGIELDKWMYAHNNYIELLVDLGIVGFVFFYSAYLFAARKLFRSSEEIEKLFGALIIADVVCHYSYVAYMRFPNMLMLCLSFALIRLRRDNLSNFH